LLDHFFDLLDPSASCDAVSFQLLRTSLNQVLGNVHSAQSLSVEALARMVIDFGSEAETLHAERMGHLERSQEALGAALEKQDSALISSALTQVEEAQSILNSSGPSSDVSDIELFLSLSPEDILLEYDALFHFLMEGKRVDWKAQFQTE
jgi:hypothetical protein